MNVSVSYIGMVNSHYLRLGETNLNVFGYEFDNRGKITGYCYSGGRLEKSYFSKGLIENLYDFFYNERIHSIDLNQYKITSNRTRYLKTKTFFKFKLDLFENEV